MYKIEPQEDGNIIIKIPTCLRTFAGRKRIITPGAPDRQSREMTDSAVLMALARARHWQKLIDDGRFSDATAIAKEIGVNSSYVMRILRLNLLSPRIVRQFLQGQAPDGLSLTKLFQPLPDCWEEQERLLLS